MLSHTDCCLEDSILPDLTLFFNRELKQANYLFLGYVFSFLFI